MNLFSIFTVIFTSVLVGCGGGGGGSSPAAPTTVTVTCPNGSSQTAATADLANAQCAAAVMLSILPLNGTTAVHVDTFVSVDVTTDSTLDASSITTANVTLKAGLNAIAGTASAVGTKAFKFTPSGKLNYGQVYTFSASVKDSLGRILLVNSTFTTASISCVPPQIPNNAGDACIAPITITCPNGSSQTAATADLAKAQCAAPLMLSISPANGATAVSVDTFNGVNVVTDSTLDASSITTANITLKAGANAVVGSASPVGTFGLKFLPTAKLNYGQAYTFTAAVKDSLGRTLSVNSTFTTSSLSCVPPQVPNSTGDGCISPPTVSVTLSQTKATVGSSVTLTWSSTNATSCTGLDSMVAGIQPTSGNMTITPTFGGRFTYTISCDGAGGTSKSSALLIVPMPVYATSYENKNSAAVDNPTIPPISEISNIVPELGEMYFSERIAFADLFQDGNYSVVVMSTMFKNIFPVGFNPNKGADSPAKIYFLQKDSNGKWTDQTSRLIKDPASRYTCITPSFLEVADLNNDKKPDVVIACTGTDFPFTLPPGETEAAPYWVSKQFIILSQADGSYRVKEVPVTSPVDNRIYGHQAAVADIDGDRNADILYVDPNGNSKPFIAWGNGDGTFRQDMTRFPTDILNSGIYGIRAIPIDGKINVVVSASAAGSDPNYPAGYGSKVLHYVNGKFEYLGDFTIPTVVATGLKYGLGLDFIYKNGFYYGYFVDWNYANQAILKLDLKTGVSSILGTLTQPPGYGGPSGNILIRDNSFVNVMADCGNSATKPSDWLYYACAMAIPIQ